MHATEHSLSYPCSLSLSLSLSLYHGHKHSFSNTYCLLSLSLARAHALTLSLSLSLSHTHSHCYLTAPLSLSLYHIVFALSLLSLSLIFDSKEEAANCWSLLLGQLRSENLATIGRRRRRRKKEKKILPKPNLGQMMQNNFWFELQKNYMVGFESWFLTRLEAPTYIVHPYLHHWLYRHL